jgi:hypothetical protein
LAKLHNDTKTKSKISAKPLADYAFDILGEVAQVILQNGVSFMISRIKQFNLKQIVLSK